MSVSSLIFMFSSSFVALFPVINPVGNSFIINGFFTNLSVEQRKSAVRKLVANYILVGVGTLLIGHLFLLLFGLAIPVIQLGGGLLICKTAIELLSDTGDTEDKKTQNVEDPKSNDIEKKLFYPITFPMSVGPGSISVIFTLMASASVSGSYIHTGINYAIIALVIACMAGILYLFLSQGRKVMEKLGTAGNLIINKLVAFFTFCIGIQIVVTGISKIFHLEIL